MTQAERLAMRELVNAAKGARDTLQACTPPLGKESRVARDIRRLEAGIGRAEAMLSGAGAYRI
jgi:hypothetical protein